MQPCNQSSRAWLLALALGFLTASCTTQAGSQRAVSSTAQSPTPDPRPLTSTEPAPATKTKLQVTYTKLPLHFEPNYGQTDEQVSFLSRGSRYTLFLTSFQMRG